MKTSRFEYADIKYLRKGIIITGKCDDDRGIYLASSKIKRIEFNRLLLEPSYSFNNDTITIVTDNNEFYDLENKSNILAGMLKELLEFINV